MDRRVVDKRFRIFDKTFGYVVRLIESSRVRLDPEPPGVRHRLIEMELNDSAKYALENFGQAQFFKHRADFQIYLCVLISDSIQSEYAFAEFGVQHGESINRFAKNLPPTSKIFGFDSFEGLPEEWTGFGMRKGSFDMGGKPPKVLNNCELIPGWFSETIPKFLSSNNLKFDMIHLDADIYSSTKFVLDQFVPHLKDKAILIFDEFYGYVNWRSHEYRAFQEWTLENEIAYEYIAYTDMQVAVRITLSQD